MKIKFMNRIDASSYSSAQLEVLKKSYEEEYQTLDITKDDIDMFGRIYCDKWGAHCLEFHAAMAFKYYEPDVWCEGVFMSDSTCVQVGFYLSDAWQSTGDNREELQRRAYIRRYNLLEA